MKTLLFWINTQLVVLISCSKYSHYSLHNCPQQRSSQLLRGRRLKKTMNTT
jgi:hypothetical protein